jgi:hypothetical protein
MRATVTQDQTSHGGLTRQPGVFRFECLRPFDRYHAPYPLFGLRGPAYQEVPMILAAVVFGACLIVPVLCPLLLIV